MKTPYILMIENDEDDQYITHEYFSENSVIPVSILGGSDELFQELQHCIQEHKALPALILLNYYSGPIATRETLTRLKQSPALRHIPVVILCGTADYLTVRDCYSWGASSFIQKPTLVEETNKKIANFIAYWFDTVELA